MSLSSRFRLRLGETLADALNGAFGHLPLSEFTERLADVEGMIATVVGQCLQLYLMEQYPTFKHHGADGFTVRGRHYTLRIAPRLDEPRLQAFILPDDKSESWNLESELTIHGWGFINGIDVKVANRFEAHLTALLEVIDGLYRAAYVWLEDQTRARLARLDLALSMALYGHLRPVLAAAGKSNLDDYIWFGIFTEDAGHYLVDLKSSSRAVTLLSARQYRSVRSPAFHLLALFGTSIPYPQSISRLVLESNEPIDFKLPRAAYAAGAPDFAKSEEQIFPGGVITLVPIAKLRHAHLSCGFPAAHKKEVLGLVIASKQKLATLFEANAQSGVRYLREIKRHLTTFDWANAGGFLGSFSMAAAKQLMAP